MYCSLFYVRYCMLNRAWKGVFRFGFSVFRRVNGSFGSLRDARALQGWNLHNLTAQGSGQFGGVDFVAILFDNIHHVDGNDHGNAEFGKLCGQIQVPFKVRAVNDI